MFCGWNSLNLHVGCWKITILRGFWWSKTGTEHTSPLFTETGRSPSSRSCHLEGPSRPIPREFWKKYVPKNPLVVHPRWGRIPKKIQVTAGALFLTIFDFDIERASAGHWNSVPWAIGAPRHGMCIKWPSVMAWQMALAKTTLPEKSNSVHLPESTIRSLSLPALFTTG